MRWLGFEQIFVRNLRKKAMFIEHKLSFFEQKDGRKDAEDDAAGIVRWCLRPIFALVIWQGESIRNKDTMSNHATEDRALMGRPVITADS